MIGNAWEDKDVPNDADALKWLEWGSCDGCGRHSYCPVCDQPAYKGHDPKCPVPRLLGGARVKVVA